MADAQITVSSKKPNMRFGTSFLNTKFRKFAAKDEALMDKSSGEVAYKRLSDGSFLYFNRENINIENWLLFMRSAYEYDTKSVHPTEKKCTEFANTYLMGTQFDLQDFVSTVKDENDEEIRDFTKGIYLRNPDNVSFNISHEMNGIFVEVKANPRALPLLNLISSVYDRYFEDYDGSVAEYLTEKSKFDNSAYYGNCVEIGYSVTYYAKDGSKENANYVGYCNLNSPAYIPFGTRTIRSRETTDFIRISLDYVALPKLKYGLEIKDSEFTERESDLYDRIKDEEVIELKCADMFVYTTTTDNRYRLPQDSVNVIALTEAKVIEDSFARIGMMSSASGVICRIKSPTSEEWERINMWAERCRMVKAGGDTENLGSETNIDDLEGFFGRLEEIESNFTLDITRYGFYLETITQDQYDLPW